eukprot:115291-Chlamydomonas_euryale.AAC.6
MTLTEYHNDVDGKHLYGIPDCRSPHQRPTTGMEGCPQQWLNDRRDQGRPEATTDQPQGSKAATAPADRLQGPRPRTCAISRSSMSGLDSSSGASIQKWSTNSV